MQTKSNQQRISVIQGMMKFCILVLVILFVIMLFPSEDEQQIAPAIKVVNIKIKEHVFTVKPDFMQLELINNRPLLIIKYSDQDKKSLQTNDNWFIAWAQGTDLSCPLKRINAQDASQKLAYPVDRGLQDQCRGSIYNLQGKVLPNQLAKQDLRMPDYSIEKSNGSLMARIKVPVK